MNFQGDKQSEDQGKSIESTSEDSTLGPAVTRKVDFHLLPVLTLLYLLSFLDRTNVGNASVEGLSAKIHLVGGEYNAGLALYFVGYVLFEIPANIMLKRTSPNVWLPSLTFVWGIVAVCQGLVHNKAGFYAVRFFLGVTEAGLFPGVTYVFSMYYTRAQRSLRIGFFFSGAALAGAFGGIFAYALGRIKGGGKPGWAWIFIVEGLLTIVISLLAFFFVPTWPQEARFLTERERACLLERLRRDNDAADVEPFNLHGVRQALTDPLAYLYALLFHCNAFPLYSISLFLPTIIKGLGFATWKAQLLTTPPYAFAFIVTMGSVWLSVRARLRAPFIIGAASTAIIGYIILITTSRVGAQYAGTFITVAGVYTANALLLSWPSENISAQTKRAVVLALQISIGDVGAIAGVLVYRGTLSAHHYRTPHIIALCYELLGIVVTSALYTIMERENRRREASGGEREKSSVISEWESGWKEGEGELLRRRELGDRHPAWRYQL